MIIGVKCCRESQKEQVCGASIGDSVKMKLLTWQGRLWRSGGGGRQTGVGGEMDGNAEMDGVTHSWLQRRREASSGGRRRIRGRGRIHFQDGR